MKLLNFTAIPPWVKRQRERDEELLRAELERDSTLRILYEDCNDMAYIGYLVHMYGYSYYRSIIDIADGLLKHVVQAMQASNIPQHLWAQMQDMGVDNVGVHVAMHNIQYGLKIDRSNWNITPDTLRLLERTYDRGRAIGAQSLNRQLAFEAHRKGDYEAACEYATLDQKLRIIKALPIPSPTPFH